MCYDVDINKWFIEMFMFFKCVGFCLVVCDGFVYVIGGLSDRNEFLCIVEWYDLWKKIWRDVMFM